ncbi:MAG: hypothetical protein AB1651_14110 [Pseudomonadota bacterium]
MSRTSWIAALGVAVAVVAAPVQARKPVPAQPASDFWVSFGGGYYDGQDYDPPPGQPKGPAQEADGAEALLALNIAGPVLARLRVGWMADYTSNTAEEVGVLLGVPAGPGGRAYLAAGVSRLTDVSNREQSPTIGVPIELLLYPTRGLEVGIHGNFNPDSDFIGITLAGVFGKRRAE